MHPVACEAVAELLQDLTGSGVTIEPPIKALGPDEGYTLDEAAPQTLRAYVYGEVPASRRAGLRRHLRPFLQAIEGRLSWRTIREEDWAEAWKTYYDIEHVGRVVIRPAWKEYAAEPGELIVSLDPGMAFGTGQHPTTRMCLQALQELLQPSQRVLDLGTGSGILAIAAALLGAGSVVASDIEELAIKASRGNFVLNFAADRITLREGSLDTVAYLGPFDFVLANINAATVARLAGGIYASMAPGAYLLAGGIIEEREALSLEALTRAGFTIVRKLSEGDWRTFVCQRPGSS